MIKGGITVVLLALAAVIVLPSAAFSYAGIVRLSKAAVLSGVTDVKLFSGTKPNQTSLATLAEGSNYTVDNTTNPTYRIYNIYDAPGSPAYLLLLKGSTYSIISGAMGTTVPPTTTFDSAPSYKLGKPDAPQTLTEKHGYETAKVNWALNDKTDGTGFEYSWLNVELASDASYTTKIKTTTLGKTLAYAMGELVDGSKLDSGKQYWFRVNGLVDGVAPSDWSEITYTTLSGAGALTPTTETWNLKVSGTGINTFAIPFIANAATTKPISYETTTVGIFASLDIDGNGIHSVEDLIRAINTKAGSNIVTVFGWYDAATQKHVGLTSIAYPDLAKSEHTGAVSAAVVLGASIVTGQPYQVTVTIEKTFKLKGYKQ
jgi:hypothetical protein